MIYIEDISVFLGTQKGSIIRGTVCTLLIAGTVLNVFGASSKNKDQLSKISENEASIADYKHQKVSIQEKIDTYDANADLVYYSTPDVTGKLAEIQNSYFGLGKNNISDDEFNTILNDFTEAMVDYSKSDAQTDPWYNVLDGNSYTWHSDIQESSIVNETPVLWYCSDSGNSAEGNIYAVVTGTYYGDLVRCGDYKVYYTLYGYYNVLSQNDNYDASQEINTVTGIISSISNSSASDASTDSSSANSADSTSGESAGESEESEESSAATEYSSEISDNSGEGSSEE